MRDVLILASVAVAPRAGAWIETVRKCMPSRCSIVSRPARARGLKLGHLAVSVLVTSVAPRAGAWIETHTSGYAR